MLAGLVVAGVAPVGDGWTPAGAGPATQAAAVPERYAAQTVDWEPCVSPGQVSEGPAGIQLLECATYRVPRDWEAPDGGPDLTIAASRLRPPVGEPARTLLTNPGGPGAPGRTLPLLFVQTGRAELLASHEIVGVDVRGTGASTNVSCAQLSETGRELDARDRSQRNTDLILDAASFVARACQQAAGPLGPYITTAATVRDLDLLRGLLGRETVDWLGYSGGTWLGAHYATLFPERVGRFVFDAVADFTGPWQPVFARQPLGFQRRFDVDFLPYIAANDSYFRLGDTAEEVDAAYETVRASLVEEPLAFGDGGAVYPGELDLVLAFALYSTDTFQRAGEDLRTLRDMTERRQSEPPPNEGAVNPGLAARLGQARRHARLGAMMPLSPDAPTATFVSLLCNDTPWVGDRASLLTGSAATGAQYPLLGWHELSAPCVFWDRSASTLPVPTGAGLPPVLMINSERDPATPVEGARAARDGFPGSVLLEVGGGDHASYAIRRNDCVDRAVEAFLVDGILPAADAHCEGAEPSAPNPLPEPGEILDTLPVG